ncbi:cytochrome P450 monooxygenase pc-3 [Athelia psychrophila]|uniref:Cytochrome P450 monooxygenase pc-3 n=1 Tax=Athelia psychrophila TaxID=1759441 RepID=A0A166H0E2_9AGAM|nr:cytochrome P450 monooxygenase pc-3 [Fibularhizoctonia sp. CBS 109695]
MPTFLTPGILFLARGAPKLVFPCALIGILRYILDAHFGITISIARIVLGAAVLLPLLLTAKRVYGLLYMKRRAAALGARLVPFLPGGIGNVDRLMRLVRSMDDEICGEVHVGWTQECGNTLNMNLLWGDAIFTIEPDHIKAILATDFPNFVKGDELQNAFHSLLGTGVFNSDGDMWKFHRSMTRPFFTRDRITEFDNFDRHAELMITAMKDRLRSGHAIDLQDALHRFTLDSASEFLLGTDVQSLADPLPFPFSSSSSTLNKSTHYGGATSKADAFARAFADAQVLATHRSILGWLWPLAEMTHDTMQAPMAVVNAFIEPIIDRAVERRTANAVLPAGNAASEKINEIGEVDTLLDHLVKLTSDQTVLKDEILNILIAARDTTAATLTFAFYLLSQHPEAMVRLRQEVLDHVGPSARPTYAKVTDMKYLRAFINETLRLFPAVPVDIRQSVNETTWPSADPAQKPLYIPANTQVLYSAMLTHRRTDLWGPDALEFDPDRFLDDRVRKYLTPKPYIFVPFNAGPRICLGQQFAYNEMSFVIIRLLQSFTSVALDTASQPPDTVPPPSWAGAPGRKGIEKFWPQSHLTMFSKGGLWVKMEEVV